MLNSRVLVLNKSWVAVNVAPARRALVLLYQGHARVVHPEDYALYDFEDWRLLSSTPGASSEIKAYVHTPAFRIALPEIIILSAFNRFVRQEVNFSRRNIFVRDQHQCQYCGCYGGKQELSIDHVVPRSRGGKDTWDNLVIACLRCNVKKGNRTPEEANMSLLRPPAKPRWLPKFGIPIDKDQLQVWQRFMQMQ